MERLWGERGEVTGDEVRTLSQPGSRLVQAPSVRCHREPPSLQSVVYALTFEPYFRCAACFETPSIVPISDQLR